MRAQVIGTLPPLPDETTPPEHLFPRYLGEVDPYGLSEFDPAIQALLVFSNKLIRARPRKPPLFCMCSRLYLRGSTHLHEDGGMGWILNWLVSDQGLAGHEPCDHGPALYRKNAEPLYLGLGDVFIFNADKPHAWVSNNQCVVVQCAIHAPTSQPQSV